MNRGLLAEFGITLPRGVGRLRHFAHEMQAGELLDIPQMAEDVVALPCDQLTGLDRRIGRLDKAILEQSGKDERAGLLQTIPGIGPVTACAIVSIIASGRQFGSARDFAAWIGLAPLDKSSGGKEALGRIGRMGDRCLRALLLNGMAGRVRYAKSRPGRADPWLKNLLERKPVEARGAEHRAA